MIVLAKQTRIHKIKNDTLLLLLLFLIDSCIGSIPQQINDYKPSGSIELPVSFLFTSYNNAIGLTKLGVNCNYFGIVALTVLHPFTFYFNQLDIYIIT